MKRTELTLTTVFLVLVRRWMGKEEEKATGDSSEKESENRFWSSSLVEADKGVQTRQKAHI